MRFWARMRMGRSTLVALGPPCVVGYFGLGCQAVVGLGAEVRRRLAALDCAWGNLQCGPWPLHGLAEGFGFGYRVMGMGFAFHWRLICQPLATLGVTARSNVHGSLCMGPFMNCRLS